MLQRRMQVALTWGGGDVVEGLRRALPLQQRDLVPMELARAGRGPA